MMKCSRSANWSMSCWEAKAGSRRIMCRISLMLYCTSIPCEARLIRRYARNSSNHGYWTLQAFSSIRLKQKRATNKFCIQLEASSLKKGFKMLMNNHWGSSYHLTRLYLCVCLITNLWGTKARCHKLTKTLSTLRNYRWCSIWWFRSKRSIRRFFNDF